MLFRTIIATGLILASLFGLANPTMAGEPSRTPDRRDETDKQIAGLLSQGFPVIDFHVHLKGGLTLDDVLAHSRRTGIRCGIALNCGVGFPVTDDRSAEKFLKSLKGQPVFIGMQAEGREWQTLFSKKTIAQFDYIFTDAMTIVDHRGKRARLWMKDEVDIPDKQAFMELLVKTIVHILDREPIDIYVNPTYLPEVIAGEYDRLWTPERVKRVIDAAAQRRGHRDQQFPAAAQAGLYQAGEASRHQVHVGHQQRRPRSAEAGVSLADGQRMRPDRSGHVAAAARWEETDPGSEKLKESKRKIRNPKSAFRISDFGFRIFLF